MTNLEIVEKLKSINVFKTKLKIFLKNHHIDLYDAILKNTSFLNNSHTFAERLYCVKNNLTDIPLCKNCHANPVSFNTDISKYRDYCSIKCQKTSYIVIEKRMKSISENGVGNNVEKAKATKLQKQKIDPTYNDKIVEKRKKTNLARHGISNYVNSEKLKETKKLNSDLDPEYYKNISKKVRETKLNLYGDSSYNNIKQTKETNLEKYGVEFPFQSVDIREKSRKTTLEKYGVDNNFHIPANVLKRLKPSKIDFWNNNLACNDYSIPMFDLDHFLNILPKSTLKFKCKKCGKEFENIYQNLVIDFKCPDCYPRLDNRSHAQSEIFNFIRSIYKSSNIIMNARNILPNQELDIYIPEKRLAIEFDGLYWHSDNRKENNYHLKKTMLCESIGIHLIHIFEDEWEFKTNIVKSKIKYLLGIIDKKVYARKCKVAEINNSIKSEFLNDNHIQGDDKSKIKFGLFFNDELMAVATFSKARFNEKYDYEVIRYATKLGYCVIGGFGKLLKAFEDKYNPKSIISYADKRWTTNINQSNLYSLNGFKFMTTTKPNYFYVKGCNRESRIKYQKHKLKDILRTFDPSKSEVENMRANGYSRIFDCGNLVFAKRFDVKD